MTEGLPMHLAPSRTAGMHSRTKASTARQFCFENATLISAGGLERSLDTIYEEVALAYVLIIILAGSGAAVGSVEFGSKQACETAAKMIAESNRPFAGASPITVCAPKS